MDVIEMKTTKLLRIGISAKKKKIPFIPELIQKFLRFFYGFEVIISDTLTIGKNVRFSHNGLGTVINQETTIGNNVRIYQNVTIGSNKKIVNGVEKNSGAPVIGDNVVIFSGATVVGDIEIGDNSVIGANVVVTKRIPENSIVTSKDIHILKKSDEVLY